MYIDQNSPYTPHLITFMEELSELTNKAAVNDTLYPLDLHKSVDYMNKIGEVSSAMTSAANHINDFTESYAEAISSLCDNSTFNAWRNFKNQV